MMQKRALASGLLIAALGWVSLLHLLSAGSGQAESKPAQDGSRAVIKFLDKSQFYEDDQGQVLLRMDILDATGNPILGLTKEQVQVTEEGSPAEIVAFRGPGTQPINVLLVVDISGSMGDENRMSGAIEAALSALDELTLARDRLGIIAFDNVYDVVQPLERINRDNKPIIQQKIRSLQPRGGTTIGAPTLEALRLFERDAPDGLKVVMVMTDGEDHSLATAVDAIAVRSDAVGVPIYTIGFGGGASGAETTLQDLAQKCKGEFYHAPTAEELARIYRSQVQELTNEFTVSYRSPYPAADGLPRRVDIEIAAAGGTLAATTNYQIGSIVDSGGRTAPLSQAGAAASGNLVSGFAKVLIFGVLLVMLSGALGLSETAALARVFGGASAATVSTPGSSPPVSAVPGNASRAPPPPPPPPRGRPAQTGGGPPVPSASLGSQVSQTPASPAAGAPSSSSKTPGAPPMPRPAPPLSGPPGAKTTIRPIAPPPPPPPGKSG
jgi:Ca-activated chloride channel homolog